MPGEIEKTRKINETVYRTDTALKGTNTTLFREMFFADKEQAIDGIGPEERLFDAKATKSLTDIITTRIRNYTEDDLTPAQLQEKRRDMLDAMFDFEVLHFEKSGFERMQEKEKITQKREEKKRQLDIPETLFSSSREQKLRVLKSLKLDEYTKKNLMSEEKSLEEILHTHVTKEEQQKAAKDGKNFLKVFRNAKAAFNNNPLLTAEEKAQRLYRLAKPYEMAVAMYKEEYFTTLEPSSRHQEIENLLDRITRFYDLYAGNGDQQAKLELLREMEITDIQQDRQEMLEDIRYRTHEIDRSKADEPDDSLDANLSDEQIAGIEAVDRYIIEHAETSGGNLAFVDRILKLPLRDRLLMYGLIENRREGTPSAADIAYTQIGYVPNPMIFASRMSKFPDSLWAGSKRQRFMSFITNMRWEKLESAIEYLGHADVKAVRDSFAKLSGVKTSEVVDSMETAEKTLEEPDDALFVLTDIETKRNQQLLNTINALEKCKSAMMEADKSIFHKDSKRAEAKKLSEAAKLEIEKLENLDKDLFDTVKGIREAAEGEGEGDDPQQDSNAEETIGNEIKTKPAGDSKVKKIAGTAIFAGSQSTMLLSKTDKVVSIFNGGNAPASLGIASGAFLSMSGVIGFIGGLMGAAKVITAVHDNGSSMARLDIVNMISKSTRSLGASAWGVVAGGYQIGLASAGIVAAHKAAKGALEVAQTMKDNIDIAASAVSYATVAVNGIKMGVDVVDAAIQTKRAIHHGVAAYRVHELKKNDVLRGDDATYADNILKIDRRNKIRAAVETANSFVVSGAGIVATLLGGPIGAVAYAGASVLDAVIMKAYQKTSRMLELSAMVDEFLQLDKMTENSIPNYSKLSKEEKANAKKRIREEMMAELGYVSNAAFSKHIAKNYAQFIYSKLFFVDDDFKKPLLKENDDDHTLTNISMACYQMVKSLGLRVVFPKNAGDERYPTPQMIAAKLLG